MHMHCSACGTPLPQGSKVCPACALPLAAIAMSTPAFPRRPVSILAVLLAGFGIFWVVAYTSDRVAAAHYASQPPAIRVSFGIETGLEQRIEQNVWFSAPRLYHWRAQVAENLTEAERRHSEPGAQQVIADNHAALARIDARLQELRSK